MRHSCNSLVPFRIIGGHSDRTLPEDRDASFQRLQSELPAGDPGPSGFLFSGHANYSAVSGQSGTLGFTNRCGKFDTPLPTADEIAAVLTKVPGLELVFLNGCESKELAARIKAGGVANVVCWRTKARDHPLKSPEP